MESKLSKSNSNLNKSNSNLSKSNLSKSKSNLNKSNKSPKVKSKCINDTYYWEPISEKWASKLGSPNFMIKNCLGDGNCQFRSIETALTQGGYRATHEKLRKLLAKYILSIDNKVFIDIIKTYQIEKQNGEFVGNWDPMTIKNKRDFIKIIKRPGFDFQGDFISLELISRAIGIDIIIFTNDLDIINLSDPDNLQNKIIILYYDKDQGHYKTIGLKKKEDKFETIFKRSKLQNEISRILDKDSFLSFHIDDICNADSINCEKSKLHLNYIINKLEERLDVKISRNDKKKVMQLIMQINIK